MVTPLSQAPNGSTAIAGVVEQIVSAADGTPLCAQVVDDAPNGRLRPTLLIVNGLGATMVTWRFVVDAFRDRFRIVSFDTRGLHKSGRPLGGARALDVDAHASDVVAVAAALGRGPLHAAGWSMGVQVLVEAAPRLGARLRSLVLHNGVAGRAFAGIPGKGVVDRVVGGSVVDGALHAALSAIGKRGRQVEALVARLTRDDATQHQLIDALIRVGLVHHGIDRPTFSAAAAGFRGLDADVFVTILQHLGRHDAWPLLPQIAAPTLVVAGSHDRMTPLSAMQRMARALPHGELAVLAGGTHYAALEVTPEFVDVLGAFWARHGAFVATDPVDGAIAAAGAP